jgi:hypothetical protein
MARAIAATESTTEAGCCSSLVGWRMQFEDLWQHGDVTEGFVLHAISAGAIAKQRSGE